MQTELFIRAEEKVKDCIRQVQSFYRRPISFPTVQFDLRGKTAGIAYPHRNLIRFNGFLLAENTEHFLSQTVPHEVAHLVAHFLYGTAIKPHGKEWRMIMSHIFGLSPDRCHRYDTRQSQVRRMSYYEYTCACSQNHRLSAIRHHRLLRQEAQYRCRRCGSMLAPLDQPCQ